MQKLTVLATIAALGCTGSAVAQECESSWTHTEFGGFEADSPEAASPCGAPHSIAVICIYPALAVNYYPMNGLPNGVPTGGEYWPITLKVGDFTYSDYAQYYGATDEFGFMRLAWDREYPLFEALQSGQELLVSMPSLDLQGRISLSGSREAISKLLSECERN